jgi:hypothetical protein
VAAQLFLDYSRETMDTYSCREDVQEQVKDIYRKCVEQIQAHYQDQTLYNVFLDFFLNEFRS